LGENIYGRLVVINEWLEHLRSYVLIGYFDLPFQTQLFCGSKKA